MKSAPRLALMACLVAAPTLAQAGPTLSVRAYDITNPASQVAIALSQSSSTTGVLSATGAAANFPSVNVTASGAPYANGGLAATTLDIAGLAGTTLRLQITQVDLTGGSAIQPFQVGFTFNSVTSGTANGASFSTYVSGADQAYAMTTLVAGQSMTAATGTATYSAAATVLGLAPGGLYSETEQVDISFASAGTVTASSQITPAVSVPEPSSLASCVIAGAAGLGARRLRRRRAATG